MDRRHTKDAKTIGVLASTSDLVLAALVIAIICLMILPLPRLMIDALVAINITVGVMLVLMGIYISSVLQFSAFPSVLLLSTLFRLALSVATTRMILLHGDAGHIIETFGSMVAGGNLVVGLVVFLIITLVQFLVIAKGAERVAEVGARFTLDAMPGKQLSIDSDLRSGLIDKREAKRKRRELEMESKLHGSMDGAMKFVKGDAIAGIVIIIVNLLGGLAIGVFQLGMDASAAAAKYSILTIGDGLVAQIPALLGAMAAGLIVTRATDNEQDRHLGDSIQKQFSAIPRVLLVAGVLSCLMSLVPGFPSLIFIALGFSLLLGGGLLIPAMRTRIENFKTPAFNQVLDRKQADARPIESVKAYTAGPAIPLLLRLPARLAGSPLGEQVRTAVEGRLDEWQQRSGVPLPAMTFQWQHDSDNAWELLAFEVPLANGELLKADGEEIVAEELEQALRRNADLFIGIQETSDLLAAASIDYPDIVKESMRNVPTQTLTVILQNLAREEISLRNMRGILEALVQASQQEKDPANLTEFARMALSRQICHRLAPSGTMRAIAVSAALEDELIKSLRSNQAMTQLALDPATAKRLRENIATAEENHRPRVLVSSVSLRRHLRTLIADHCFELPVLSYNELVPNQTLDVVFQLPADTTVQLKTVK